VSANDSLKSRSFTIIEVGLDTDPDRVSPVLFGGTRARELDLDRPPDTLAVKASPSSAIEFMRGVSNWDFLA
jgi:hypothetical protein